LACLFFVGHQYSQYIGLRLLFADNYLDPFLFPMIMLHLIEAERRWLLQDKMYTLPLLHVLVITSLTAFLFEGLAPHFQPLLYSDWWDILFYFAGAFIHLVARYVVQIRGTSKNK
jgi:hypothetical protein